MALLENGLKLSFATGKYFFHFYLSFLKFIFALLPTDLMMFLYSWAIVPGSSLLAPATLAIAYLVALGYCFFGIAIISDIFMEAIEAITAQTKAIELWDKERKSVSIN
jgi:hypothetical protein